MRIISDDGNRSVDIGASDIWHALYSTAVSVFGKQSRKVDKALEFMRQGICKCDAGYETARQFNLIRDELSKISPKKLVYDINDTSKQAPWGDRISPVITSCGNLFTTANGEDLIYEIVSILVYAKVKQTDLYVE